MTTHDQISEYRNLLSASGKLSKLFSDNLIPFLVPRSVENIYCLAFGAENLGRADCSADAALDGVGVGIKTFIHGNGRTLQKIAEFNKDARLYRGLQPRELILKIAELRNERINVTKRMYGLADIIYHCVTRAPGEFQVHELSMDLVDIPNIRHVSMKNKNTITFEDGINSYSFNLTKSTLYKRFLLDTPLYRIPVDILDDPYSFIKNINSSNGLITPETAIVSEQLNPYVTEQVNPYVILPLFSDRGKQRHVPERSGLNQWNANGRARHHDEVYVPIPKRIHTVFPNFFPPRDQPFTLILPDHSRLDAKVCQDDSKALMTNPNKDLGEWLLRTVFELQPRELLTYEYLEVLGIDSVRVERHDDSTYSIDFCEMGTYDDFQTEYL